MTKGKKRCIAQKGLGSTYLNLAFLIIKLTGDWYRLRSEN